MATGQTLSQAERSARLLLRGWGTPYDTARAVRTWAEIRRAGVTLFEFSPGGDAIIVIAWSSRDRRFYRLLECC